MFNPDHIHIAIASDQNYAKFVAVALASFFDTNTWFRQATIHLLSTGITKDGIANIKKQMPVDKSELIIHNLSDISDRLQIPVPTTISISSYNRLFLSEIISSDVDRILYIDCDVLFNKNISSLWKYKIENSYLGGVLDTLPDDVSKLKINLKPTMPYINAGILLINLKKWRDDNLSHKFLAFLKAHNGIVHHHDQGIINGVCKNKITILPPIYNATTCYFSHKYDRIKSTNTPFYSISEFNDAINNPHIVHFTEGFLNRPWRKNCNHPMKNIYRRYYCDTLGYDLEPDNRSYAVKILSYSFRYLPYSFYSTISRTISFISRFLKH